VVKFEWEIEKNHPAPMGIILRNRRTEFSIMIVLELEGIKL